MAQPPTDASIKQRIIAHMNADHTDSLSRYLEAYAGVSHFSARSAKLEDFTLSSLLITTTTSTTLLTSILTSSTTLPSKKEYIIPLSPPLSSYSEARPRLIAMHLECGTKLGRDNSIVVKKFRWPGVFHCAVIFGVFLGLFCFADGKNFAPDSLLARTLFRPVPLLARVAERYHLWFWWGIVGGHTVEAWLMVGWLRRYNVRLFSDVWWLYVGFIALEGYGCAVRLNKEVREERRKVEGKEAKH